MKHKKINLVCYFLVSTIALTLPGCTNDNSEKGYTEYAETSSRVETEHTHKYTIEVVASSCIEKGYTRYECDCGYAYIEDETAALGHNYETSVVAPTTRSQGYTLYTCSRCSNSYKDEFTEKLFDASGEVLALADPEVIYHGAIKDYLLPLEDFSREREHDPQFVMIHFISAVTLSKNDPYNVDTIRSIFVDYEVSVHYIIDRDGTIRCYIPENLVAWHAGVGTWNDDPKYTNKLNDYAIGIELVAIGSQNDMKQYLSTDAYNSLNQSLIGYTDAQYEALKELVRDICQRNHIPMDREHVIGHEEYSPQKTDPGELFDWERLLA